MSSASSSFVKWLAGIAAAVIGALIIWSLTHPGGIFNPNPTATPILAPQPTATALIDTYSGTWVYPYSEHGSLPVALYRVKIENVNSQNSTATFSVCRCLEETCNNKANLTPLKASAEFKGSKLVSEPVYLDQQRTVYWTLKAIKVGNSLTVTVEQYKNAIKEAGPEDFSLDLAKINIHDGQVAIDECESPPELYLEP